jgi:transposase
MGEGYRLFVGIDWATATHQVCVLDEAAAVVGERSVAHAGDAIAAFTAWLEELAAGEPGRVAVAIEVPRGAVVDALVERGFHVYAINPKQLDRFRDRYSVAGAKDDRRDAFVAADSLRTDRACFRRVQLEDPLIIQLRELSRVDEELAREGVQLANRLREQLHRFFPQMLQLSSGADEPWLWALLDVVPTPAAAQRVRVARVTQLLRAHRIRRLQADGVVTALRTPALFVAPGVVEAATEHIALLLPRLRLVHAQRQRCGQRIEALLERLQSAEGPAPEHCEHRDVEILRSLPGVGRVVTATVLAEASAAVAARDYHTLRARGGVAPVTKQSGKRRTVHMRYACDRRLRNAFYHWARVAMVRDALSRAYYATLRERGHSHSRALRSVADRLLRILIALLTTRSLYDPNHPRRVRPDLVVVPST